MRQIALPLVAILASLLFHPSLAQEESEKGSALPGPAGEEVIWAESFDAARKQALAMPRGRILVEFFDESCMSCEMMAQIIHPSASFFGFTRDKVPVRVLLSSVEGGRLAARFAIPSAPAWVVTTPDLLLCGVQVGATDQYRWIQTFVETERKWALYRKSVDAEAKSPDDRSLIFTVAEETFKRLGDAQAEPRFARLAADPKTDLPMRERSLAYLASIYMDSQRFDEAEKTLTRLLATGKEPHMLEKAELSMAEIELARGRKDKATARLLAFGKAHPGSANQQYVDELMKALRPEPAVPKGEKK